jgi:hypothetical protein
MSFGKAAPRASYADLLTTLSDDLVEQVLVANPRALLTVRGS